MNRNFGTGLLVAMVVSCFGSPRFALAQSSSHGAAVPTAQPTSPPVVRSPEKPRRQAPIAVQKRRPAVSAVISGDQTDFKSAYSMEGGHDRVGYVKVLSLQNEGNRWVRINNLVLRNCENVQENPQVSCHKPFAAVYLKPRDGRFLEVDALDVSHGLSYDYRFSWTAYRTRPGNWPCKESCVRFAVRWALP